ncbi:large subunit ribosomal protein L25 [Anaerosphaera aminiphila DSM 21120]|uniref:Large ribosomal subunit protein bL25 n=1 Tax=Anaerosphaera aminiphila DSM 21120 TaxID=1120995 RepID=A0A1M5S331_9FIRM|nr:50S ribosomal protein L25 [Anaerosphaera aminiphila]SHH32698.1 large subunit ribosomal protein L25 [Anaerosphaera aminiphila DSM 21120]
MSSIKLTLEAREEKGKNQVDKLRQVGVVPGVVYSKGNESKSVSAVEKDLMKIYSQAGTSNIVEASLGSDTQMVLFKDVQRHPFKNHILHFDLYLVDMTEKIRVTIPVVLENRDAIRVQPSNLLQILDEIEIECFPADLPSEALINVQDMQIGDVIEVKDLDVSKNDKIEVLTELSDTVATLQEPKEEAEEEAVEEVSAADIPTVSESEGSEE